MFSRITHQLQQITNERFGILYGYGVEDSFLNDNGIEVDIHQSLYEELRLLGYEHIVFSSPHKALFYLDAQSKDSAADRAKEDNTPPTRYMSGFVDGPLGQYIYHQPEKGESEVTQQSLKTMGDAFLIKRLHNLMTKQDKQKTAIVISQAETMFTVFTAQRLLAGYMGEWFRLPESNRNLCLLIFSAMNKEQLQQLSSNLPVPEIRDQISNNSPGQSVFISQVAGPEKDEISRLLKHLGKLGKIINENEIQMISKMIISEGRSLKHWLSRLNQMEKVDIKTLRRTGWFKVYQDPSISAWERLQNLTGLLEIKERISELKAWLEIQSSDPKRSREAPNLHMVFIGNPGTGKTTVANLIGEILFDIDFLKKGRTKEVVGTDLIGAYVGQTAKITDNIIDQAMDGVLIIDNTYALTDGNGSGFGKDAVNTIIKRLEIDKNRFVLIFTDSISQIESLFHSNPRLSGFFPKDNFILFPDLSPKELISIFNQNAKSMNLHLTPEAKKVIEKFIINLHSNRDETFSNANEIINLVRSIDRRRTIRVRQEKNSIDTLITVDDILHANHIHSATVKNKRVHKDSVSKTKVFISYSRKDLDFVEQLASDLQEEDLKVWYDLSVIGLRGGSHWRREIEKAIRESQYVLVVLSPVAVESKWVEEEFLFARELGKKIIPLLYKPCALPLGYRTIHFINVQDENYERNYREILRALNGDGFEK